MPSPGTGRSFGRLPTIARLTTDWRARYSQSVDETSDHHDDQTELWSREQWVDVPFTEKEIARDLVSSKTVTNAPTGKGNGIGPGGRRAPNAGSRPARRARTPPDVGRRRAEFPG